MTAERCREWRESLGALALSQLPDAERPALEAHLEGCPGCRAELESLQGVARLMPLADPDRFGDVPAPPAALGERIATTIAAERRSERRRRRRFGFALSGATAAVAAAVLAIFISPGGDGESVPQRHVSFESLPPKMEIGALLEPHAFGTEIHVYVKGVRSGALCRVFLRNLRGKSMPAGSFRYRWGEDSNAVLSSALDLSRTAAIGIRVGSRTFEAPVNPRAA
ncbi:MAG TPA: zf-HC2 domain-containing protein [Solirubrobacterales bacterium]|nr:zf-HC2 domain-containing protein [Solirubrobacterales bacterium]